jgi:hypothetical protein
VARFLSIQFPNCTSEAIKANSFLLAKKYFLNLWNGAAFAVYEVQFGNFSLNKPASDDFPYRKVQPVNRSGKSIFHRINNYVYLLERKCLQWSCGNFLEKNTL